MNVQRPHPVPPPKGTPSEPAHDAALCGRLAIADCTCPCLRCTAARLSATRNEGGQP